MSDDNNVIAEAFKWAEAHPCKRPLVPLTPEQQREAFDRNTGLALEAHRQVLELNLDERDPYYRAKLQAKATVAYQQMVAALKADEQKLKAVEIGVNYYAELRAALDAYYARRQPGKQLVGPSMQNETPLGNEPGGASEDS
jgi:hypothetical protein